MQFTHTVYGAAAKPPVPDSPTLRFVLLPASANCDVPLSKIDYVAFVLRDTCVDRAPIPPAVFTAATL